MYAAAPDKVSHHVAATQQTASCINISVTFPLRYLRSNGAIGHLRGTATAFGLRKTLTGPGLPVEHEKKQLQMHDVFQPTVASGSPEVLRQWPASGVPLLTRGPRAHPMQRALLRLCVSSLLFPEAPATA